MTKRGMHALRALAILMPGLLSGSACTDLPVATEGRTEVSLELDVPSTFLLEDTTTVSVAAFDPAGRRLAGAPIQWVVGPDLSRSDNFIVRRAPDTLEVANFQPGPVRISAFIAPEDPNLATDTASSEVIAGYGPIDFRFADVGRDTVLRDQSGLELRLIQRQPSGEPLLYGDFFLDRAPSNSILHGLRINEVTGMEPGVDVFTWSAAFSGTDTIIVSYPACLEPCVDTLVVTVAPEIAGIRILNDLPLSISAFGAQVPLASLPVDAANLVIGGEPVPATWELVNPADSLVVELIDSGGGFAAVRGRSNGFAMVRATFGSFTDQVTIQVEQRPSDVVYNYSPELILGRGTVDSVAYELRDGRGNVITNDNYPSSLFWRLEPAGRAAKLLEGTQLLTFESLAFGPGEAVLNVDLCPGGGPDCFPFVDSLPFYVIPDPDSIQIVDERAGVPRDTIRTDVIGSFGGVSVEVFVPDTVLATGRAEYAALDPAVVTVTPAGVLTSVSPGTGRVVAGVGTARDTVVVVVLPN